MTLKATTVYNQAIYYLQRYGSSTENLRRVLQQKAKRRQMKFNDVPPEATQWIDDAVDKCVRLKLVDDVAYTEGRVNALRRQGRSKNYILQSLVQKGVDKKIILNFFPEDMDGEDPELAAAQHLVRKKRLGKSSDRAIQQKDLGKLLRAGFSMSIARQALQSGIEETEFSD